MLDCHDGVPVKPDLDDLIDTSDARKLVDHCLERGANLSRIVSEKHRSEDGFDVHQIRCSYYSMLDCDDDAYLAARAIQFFAPGIPQVYYVGLLAGENDEARVKETGEGREINRTNFSVEQIKERTGKEVVQRLLKLIRFRNEYEAFQGEFRVVESPEHELCLEWTHGDKHCTLHIDLRTYRSVIRYTDVAGSMTEYVV
jgi:sucrose phosphorylase